VGVHIDPEAVASTVLRLRQPSTDIGVLETLEQINLGVAELFTVSGSGMMFLDEDSVSRFAVASDERARVLEQVQEDLGTGPCVDAVVHDRLVTVDDLATDHRWPEVSELVVPAGIRSMIGVPIRVSGAPIGSLNVFRDSPTEWDATESNALMSFGKLIESSLAHAVVAEQHEQLVTQLQYALDHRVVIERAVGMLMGRTGCDAIAAFNQLRGEARSRRRRVRDVAAELVGEPVAAEVSDR
jgi:GAF domain-containing protein